MRTFVAIVSGLLMSACVAPASRQPLASISSEVLVESNHSWDGGDFAYPAGEGQMTVTRILMPKGASLPMHCHPVPLAGMVTTGRLEVLKEDGQTRQFGAGEGLIEVSRQWHYGTALEDVEIVVVYAGATDLPVTVFKDSDPEITSLCK